MRICTLPLSIAPNDARLALIKGSAVLTVSPLAGWVASSVEATSATGAAPPLVAPVKFTASEKTFGLFASIR